MNENLPQVDTPASPYGGRSTRQSLPHSAIDPQIRLAVPPTTKSDILTGERRSSPPCSRRPPDTTLVSPGDYCPPVLPSSPHVASQILFSLVKMCHTQILLILLYTTKPKPAYGRQGLGWDRQAMIQFRQVKFGRDTFLGNIYY